MIMRKKKKTTRPSTPKKQSMPISDKYLLPWLTLLSGLCISAVAVWYSVAGLVAIFAASALAITLMGVVLEVGKLVSAVWLHRNWYRSARWLKTYLAVSVVVLMFITSMGIFGFLSKAHVEQTALSDENLAQVEAIDDKLERSKIKMDRWQDEINRLLSTGNTTVDSALMAQDRSDLKDVRAQIKSEKDVIRKEAEQRIQLAQGMENAQEEITLARTERDEKLAAVDKKYARELRVLNNRINKARRGTTNKAADADKRIKELEANIEQEQDVIDEIRAEKLEFEKEVRKLEAEVGPIKYIAEFIYGETDKTILEKAVTWVIIIIIFVFDPLAVGLLIASQYSFAMARGEYRKTIDNTGEKSSVLDGRQKTKVIEKVYEVEADVDDSTPKDIQVLEQQIKDKTEK